MNRELYKSKLIEIVNLNLPKKYLDWIGLAIFCKYGFIVEDILPDENDMTNDYYTATVYGRYDISDPNLLPRKHGMQKWLDKEFKDITVSEIM